MNSVSLAQRKVNHHKNGFIKTSTKINRLLTQEKEVKKSVIINANEEDSIAVGLDEKIDIIVNGNVGDFFGALNNGADLVLNGNAGRFAGDVMHDGKIVIEGDCSEGAGMYMYGGELIINGDAGDNVGQISKGGVILIKGNAGDLVGLYLTGGDIIVLNNIGKNAGDWMILGRIFVGGKIGSLGNNAKIEDLSSEDMTFLREVLSENKIDFDIRKIKKIIPKKLRPFYKGKNHMGK